MEPHSKFVYDEDHMSGKGTLESYFTSEARDEAATAGYTGDLTEILKELQELAEERDDDVDRLCLQLFSEFSGIKADTPVEVYWPDTDYTREGNLEAVANMNDCIQETTGLLLIGWSPDDPVLALYRDGEPISAFYASYRGMYQAGGYVVQTGQHYFAHNFLKDEPMNVWIPRDCGCSGIARDFLNREGLFDFEAQELEEEEDDE